MSKPAKNFDRLARSYRLLEYLAFGRDLERARFSLLPHLEECRRVLVLGEGDGRCLERLIAIAPDARIDCLDISPAMLARAEERLKDTHHHVVFRQADILTEELPSQHYDAVVTCFFLDCFTHDQAQFVVSRIAESLIPGALWLWSDFVLPPKGLSRCRAKIWLSILYPFFRWQTGLQTSTLPPSEQLITTAGFRISDQCTYQWGLVHSVVFNYGND